MLGAPYREKGMCRYSEEGIPPEIVGATNYVDRIRQATKSDFPPSADIPLPGELAESINWVAEVPTTTSTKFRNPQLESLRKLVADSEPTQKEWATSRPHEFRGDGCRVKCAPPNPYL